MIPYSKKLKIAKARKKLREQPQQVEVKSFVDKEAILNLNSDLNDLALFLKNVLTDESFKVESEKQLTEINNQVVLLSKALSEGLLIKNQPILDEVTVKNLNEIVIPNELSVKNFPELPKDLATNANIINFQKALTASLEQIRKTIKANAPVEATTSQEVDAYVPYRRVIVRNGRAEFDDSALSNLRIPVPLPTYQNSLGQPMRPTLNNDGSVPVAIAGTSVISGAVTITSNPLAPSPLVGQAKIALTGTAVRLNGGTSQPLTNGIIISAAAANAHPISVGASGVNNTQDGTGNGYLLAAGASVSFAASDTNVIYINGTSGDYVSWAGS